MSVDVGNLLIGLGVIITTIVAILFKIRYVRNKCSQCLVTDKSLDKDIESATKIASEIGAAVPRAYWSIAADTIKKALTPRELKAAEQVIKQIEEIGEESKNKE
jgi:hypothetical protein